MRAEIWTNLWTKRIFYDIIRSMNNIAYAGKSGRAAREFAESKKFWQLIRCSGRGEVRSGKAVESYTRGDVLVIPPLTAFERTGENLADEYIFMDGTALPFKSPKAVPEERGGGFAHVFAQAAGYYSDGSPKSAAVLSALGDLLVGYIVAQTDRPAHSPVVESICADIAANVSNTAYALDMFLKGLPLNYDYIRKLFKSEVGVTPHEYLTEARMQLASRLILSGMSNQYSRYSISQIAEMCGFAEPLYFSRVFKKRYGVAPSMYGR